jgi:hypothetical protein
VTLATLSIAWDAGQGQHKTVIVKSGGAHDRILPDRTNRINRIERVRAMAAGPGL